MKLETLRDLLVEELADLYDAEHQLAETLPKLANKAKSERLKQAFEQHLGQTREHISRLERAFEMLEKRPQRKPCHGMKGIVEEGQELIRKRSADPDVLDAALIKAAQTAEHYEMAGYGTAAAYARQIGQHDLINLLTQTLDEEKRTDEMLTQLAESTINVRAAQ